MKANLHFDKLNKAHNMQKACVIAFFAELSLTIFSPVLLLCSNQYNNLLCKSMEWFLHYSDTGLNGLTKL